MGRLIKKVALGLIIVIVSATAFLFAMRYHDGPLEILSGGAFTTGELSAAPSNWSHLKDRSTIQFQTLDPVSSRTVWVATHEGRVFIVSGYMNQWYADLWKKWPHYLEADNRIIVRIDGKLYEQKLERVMASPAIVPVLNELSRKYLGGAQVTSADQVTDGDTWMYEIVDR
jgi:hypothetical protein